ncbi:MAG: prepilin-type N-terminal cleavage/methylation domain-containing protein [Oscillospiraceae bacterium]|nr:prepilin-type N-terminal cleavage/methylation domain-containing protein [Oscillospiraceae bacterium]
MKLMQILKSRKGFTLMELIVVLIIIAILMAALLPTLIGWINESRENTLRVEGRTALMAIQSTTTHARGTGEWSDGARTDYVGFSSILLDADLTFQNLIQDAGIYSQDNNTAWVAGAVYSAADNRGLVSVYLDANGSVVGVAIGNNVRTGRNIDGIGNGLLLVGNSGDGTPVPLTAGGGGGGG